MSTTIYSQLLADTQDYIKLQYKLLQLKSIGRTSHLIGVIITIVMITAIMVIGIIFLAIALAAWLEQWLPMWASYLVIAGAMLLIAGVIYFGRRWWFVRPVERHLSKVILDDSKPLEQQRQSTENQMAMQRELVQRDVSIIQQEWVQIEHILQVIRNLIS
jgi:sterol desaturase/sphingolipid hydroxylase (fatty acid hydroxylase superfamily)